MDILKIKYDINLRNNKIASIKLNLKKLEGLFSLGFDMNHLSTQKKLDLRGNPWNCSCDNIDFFRYVKKLMNPKIYNYDINVIYDENDKCFSPHNFNGTLINHIVLNDLNCKLRIFDRPVAEKALRGNVHRFGMGDVEVISPE